MTVLIVSAAVVLAVLLGWPLTALVLRLAQPARRPYRDRTAAVLHGGLTIGFLERAAVVLCIVFDQPMAIGYVVAIKGLGRYPELKESPAASERFIIGTLASLIWAVLIGILGRWLLGLSVQ